MTDWYIFLLTFPLEEASPGPLLNSLDIWGVVWSCSPARCTRRLCQAHSLLRLLLNLRLGFSFPADSGEETSLDPPSQLLHPLSGDLSARGSPRCRWRSWCCCCPSRCWVVNFILGKVKVTSNLANKAKFKVIRWRQISFSCFFCGQSSWLCCSTFRGSLDNF